jgi:hypothetical protein
MRGKSEVTCITEAGLGCAMSAFAIILLTVGDDADK